METKLCRICGKLGQNFIHIFKTEGLKNKIETCLPIVISQHCLLPDTICGECSENVDNFYSFIKNCLQNIIILEAQYDIIESCLKTKRKFDKGCYADLTARKYDKNIQTDDYLDVLLGKSGDIDFNLPITPQLFEKNNFLCDIDKKPKALVDYEIESDSNSDNDDIIKKTTNKSALNENLDIMNKINNYVDSVLSTKKPPMGIKHYFDDTENDLINEISQRKNLKRKCDQIEFRSPKIFKMDTSNRRKNKQPKKFDTRSQNIGNVENQFDFTIPTAIIEEENINSNSSVVNLDNQLLSDEKTEPLTEKDLVASLPQICLLCDTHFVGPAALATHVFEAHGIDMAQIISSITEAAVEKKKKIPKLVKISDLKKNEPLDDNPINDRSEEPPTLSPSFVCPNCPAVFSTKSDLFVHLRVKHTHQASTLCGICLHQANTYINLKSHTEMCAQQHSINARYVCLICLYGDDNSKSLENHILVHEFLLESCKKQAKMFDPADYIGTNEKFNNDGVLTSGKNLSCSECGFSNFTSFKDFSTHRRSQHSIFHCDLCNKFYGRNSHLWKHVNRLHKGHPSITCQLCYKTSASKYHLAQHFNKIHSAKPCKQKNDLNQIDNDFMSQKFQAFDFQSVKQSFMKQELIEQERNRFNVCDMDDNSNNHLTDDDDKIDIKQEPVAAPKEIDSSSDLYTNIITNYTPPSNDGEFKCPKCSKGFHKKTLLKKHKKNCRPRLQKDLLTRCKSCARIFKDRQSLAKHLVNYHSEYACEICNQKVQSKCEIVSHIRFTHPKCHLVCKICGNILRSRADLIEHTRDHLNSYICQFCADSLPSKIKLKMHILSLHRKILSLSCGICLKLFETQYILRDHVRLVHRDQLAPLTSCPVCGKNYGSKWKTYDHLNKSHGRIFRACKTCLEVFDNETQLQTHYLTVHSNQTSSNNNKNITQQSTSMTNNANANVYDSDSDEQDNDEQYDYDNDDEKQSDIENTKINVNNHVSLSHDTKISLLEKRLLGEKVTEDETISNRSKNATKSRQILNDVKKEKNNELPLLVNVKKQEDDVGNVNNSPNPLQNSSKRTVYVNSNDPSYCEICLKTWPAKKHLWQHYIRCHKSVAATICGICLKTNSDYESLQEHLIENHPTLLHGQGFGSNFICRICGRYHNASSKLKLHMAIHENFDWSILDGPAKKQTTKQNQSNQETTTKTTTNGYTETKSEEPTEEMEVYEENADINYESLIEQVECSSQSENDESDVEEQEQMQDKNDHQSTSEEDDDEEVDDDSENESSGSENDLETMKDRMHESNNEDIQMKNEMDDRSSSEESNSSFSDDQNVEVKSDNGSEFDGSPEESRSESSNGKYTIRSNSTTVDSLSNSNLFRCKPEELDSAIKSISYECINQVEDNGDDEYCDLQSHSLNDNEIESAVGSIL